MKINTMNNSNSGIGMPIPVDSRTYNLPDGHYIGTIVVSRLWSDGEKSKWILNIKVDVNVDEEGIIFCKSIQVPLWRDPEKKFYEHGRDKYDLEHYDDYIGVKIVFEIKNNGDFSNFCKMGFRKKGGKVIREKI